MTTMTTTHSVVIEKDYAYPPEKVWKALSEGPLIQQWLMKNDFEPITGHAFQFRVDPVQGWNGIIDCKVVTVEPGKTLSYTWETMGLESVVTFTLTPTASGTHLRMEHAGFPSDKDAAYKGATYGWTNFLGSLDRVLSELK
jgi:uncharacterized protein YndB with AHSA1/START domain